MRCRNCHTVMMDSDPICFSCKAPAASATAAPPALTGGGGMGWLILLPVFGGALGGLVAAGLMNDTTGGGSSGGGVSWRTIKRIFGAVLILGGALFLVIAFMHWQATTKIAERVPVVASSVDLKTRSYVEAAPSWVSYTFEESKPLDETVTRKRIGYGGDVKAQCLMVRVENRWLVATVAEGFEGNELVGRLLPIDSPISQPLIERVRKQQADPKSCCRTSSMRWRAVRAINRFVSRSRRGSARWGWGRSCSGCIYVSAGGASRPIFV